MLRLVFLHPIITKFDLILDSIFIFFKKKNNEKKEKKM